MYQKISCSEKFYASERGEGVSKFSVENFLSHSAENLSRGESFSVSLISGIEKFYASEGYVMIFCRFFLVSQCRKVSWASLQCFRKFGVSKKFTHNRGYHNFSPKIFCLTVPKNFVGESVSASLISGIEKFYASEGYVTIFCRFFLVSQCRKIS